MLLMRLTVSIQSTYDVFFPMTDHSFQSIFCYGDFKLENLKTVVISYSTEACFAIHERYFQLLFSNQQTWLQVLLKNNRAKRRMRMKMFWGSCPNPIFLVKFYWSDIRTVQNENIIAFPYALYLVINGCIGMKNLCTDLNYITVVVIFGSR